MALDLPTSTQWITFPTNPLDYYTVSWKDGKERRAVYYTSKCYWGNLVEEIPPQVALVQPPEAHPKLQQQGEQAGQKKALAQPKALLNARLDILGETKIFIAAEFVESQFIGGPYEGFHIKGLAGATDETKKHKLWITMQLNECFQYAQQGKDKKVERWIVYHPPIAGTLTVPRVFQHRFFNLESQDPIKAVLDDGSGLVSRASAMVKWPAKLGLYGLGYAQTSAKSAFGHYLHTFLDGQLLQRADLLAKANNSKLAEKLSPAEKRLLAIQFIESELTEQENRKADESINARVMEEMREVAQLEGIQTKPESWWSSLFSTSTDTAAAAQKLREVSKLEKADCDALIRSDLMEKVNIPTRPRATAVYSR